MDKRNSHTHLGWIDWIRCFGALAIVLLHVIVAYFNTEAALSSYTALYFVETAVSIPLFRWAVPVFFMVSGTLLLNPEKEIGIKDAAKYMWRIVVLLLTFGYFFCLLETIFNFGGLISLGDPDLLIKIVSTAFINLIHAKSWDHLWYLYAMLLLYVLMVPLRALRKKLYSKSDSAPVLEFLMIFALALLVCGVRSLYMANILLTDDLWGSPLFMAIYQLFPLVYFWFGRWLYEHGRLNLISVVVGLASVVICTSIFAFAREFVSLRIMLPQYGVILPYSALIYLLFRHFATRSIAFSPTLRRIADASLGIYILHPLFMHLILLYGDPLKYPPLLLQISMFVIAMLMSTILTRCLKKLALFRGKL